MVNLLRGIFAAIVCGDFLLALIILQLSALRENAEIRKALTGFPPDAPPDAETPDTPPDAETDEARRVREAQEDAEAWRQVMNYSAADAYGGGDG